MNPKILTTEVQQYIREKAEEKITLPEIVLAKHPFDTISTQELAQQIGALRTIKNKAPSWYQEDFLYYPPKLNLEQTSSEKTALYKASLVSGETLIDLTGGLGIDTYFFSKKVKKITYCEINPELSAIASSNFKQLKANNIQTIVTDGIAFLEKTGQVDWIYVDPARRDSQNIKVSDLVSYTPNIVETLPLLLKQGKNVLLKTAPLLDISSGLQQLKNVTEIHIVAIKNEVKELLWVLDKSFEGQPIIKTMNFEKLGDQKFNYVWTEEAVAKSTFSPPLRYLYEPNVAILKSGAFKILSERYQVAKLHQHSHLYTSEHLISFPGRSFIIEQVLKYDKKSFKSLNITKANVTIRNFPISVREIRKRFKIREGGTAFLFFTTSANDQKIIISCKKAELPKK
ncbi:class I SAM-dependent methyltransferase [Aquimarina sp. ERC-38]|uniref:THUMP-like domain-containing protein n=1 Tax=Aquimarina sp. ERC-38 TaxID=2949996 RepID=UPI0022472A28|nr:class I SAM-dependent methyltransferase [Aquimarina sp. ERC-38]UZO80046.1 class I SAM-dependent methyltransferase [Aquimarina sp. ERC-38]